MGEIVVGGATVGGIGGGEKRDLWSLPLWAAVEDTNVGGVVAGDVMVDGV